MRLAVFASGGGSNFQAIIDAAESGGLDAQVALCVSNKDSAGALDRARRHGIATLVLDPKRFSDPGEYTRQLLSNLEEHKVDFIALAGYLRRIPRAVVEAFRWRIVNIHPALLPEFGGAGMYGIRVHRGVLEAGVDYSGATVHFVDEEYDTGAIVLQDTVPLLSTDDPETLAARVLEVEHKLYPAALTLLSHGRVRIDDGAVHILYDTP